MLQNAVDYFTYDLLGLSRSGNAWASALNFFIYDVIKITLLLLVMISVIGYLRTFLPPDKVRKTIARSGKFGYLLASSFGALTPFCSCSSIPVFFGLLEAGVPLGITLSFLITSPMINEYLVVLMLGHFGWKITGLYVLSGLAIGTTSGVLLSRLRPEEYLMEDIHKKTCCTEKDNTYKCFKQRAAYGISEAVSILRKIFLWILVGVGTGAVIHNWVPQESIETLINRTGVFSVPLAVLLGVPMYGSCAAIVPIAVVLFQKGLPLGTALAFMMAVAALSLPEAMILKRAMKLKLIIIFFAIASCGIVITGYLFNFLQQLM